MATKVIVSHRGALTAKYGAGLAAIETAIGDLVNSDAKKGLTTELLYLDDKRKMAKIRALPVVDPKKERACKVAVDRLYAARSPDYIMILGAPDVVPHQTLTNTTPDDGDATVPSDLPYACNAPHAVNVRKFLGPSRVVGRLPDIAGGTDPGYLVGLLNRAAAAAPKPKGDYASWFGLTAKVWDISTAMSLNAIFNSSDGMATTPPHSPPWQAQALAKPSVFINCHGASNDPNFYGQEGDSYPVAMTSTDINGKVAPGAVIAVECCYGAQLYDPSLTQVATGLCNAYLWEGADGFLGSTTIAYGPADSNDSADLITQYFLSAILSGASLGRACLQARQNFVQHAGPVLDPANLKTIGQFLLLGDPSVQPVEVPKTRVAAAIAGTPDDTALKARRLSLAAKGSAIARSAVFTKAEPRPAAAAKSVAPRLRELATRFGIVEPSVRSFDLDGPAPVLASAKSIAQRPIIHVVHGRQPSEKAPFRLDTILIIQQIGTKLVPTKHYLRR